MGNGRRTRHGNPSSPTMGNGKESVVVAMAVVLLAVAARPADGHCACNCDCGPVTNIAAMGLLRTCIDEQLAAVGATNRTVQLLETIYENSGAIRGCSLQGSAMNASLDQAREAHTKTLNEAAKLGHLLDTTSVVNMPAEEYTSAMQDQLLEVGTAALNSARNLSLSLGEVLDDCFQTPPMDLSILSAASTNSTPEPMLLVDDLQGGKVWLAWTLTILAGVSTIVGALFVGFATHERRKYTAFLEAFTAGVMIQGSLTGLNMEATALSSASLSHTLAFWIVVICFFSGAGACVLLEWLSHRIMLRPAHITKVNAAEPAQEGHKEEIPAEHGTQGSTLSKEESVCWDDNNSAAGSHSTKATTGHPGEVNRSSVFVVIAGVTLHNMAEGMATFTAALVSNRLGVGLAVAMVLHNIPEGISIALPYYHATGKKWKGVMWAAISGGAEVLAALAVYLVYLFAESAAVKGAVFSCLFAIAAGMMTYIGIYEMFPSALAGMDGAKNVPVAGFFAGLFVMQLTLGQLGIP